MNWMGRASQQYHHTVGGRKSKLTNSCTSDMRNGHLLGLLLLLASCGSNKDTADSPRVFRLNLIAPLTSLDPALPQTNPIPEL